MPMLSGEPASRGECLEEETLANQIGRKQDVPRQPCVANWPGSTWDSALERLST